MIEPLHEVRDTEKLNKLVKSMGIDGWIGRPILALDCSDHYQAITGSHRLAAAEIAGIEPEIETIEQGIYDPDKPNMDMIVDLFEILLTGDDDDRLYALRELADLGEVDHSAIEIMKKEA